MNIYSNSKQTGAVLVFTLVMLTLLTLVGVNSIQINKLNFSMAKNAIDQTRILAELESEMLGSQINLERIRYKDESRHLCNAVGATTSSTYVENSVTYTKVTPSATGTKLVPNTWIENSCADCAASPTAKITLTSVSCITPDVFSGTEQPCVFTGTGSSAAYDYTTTPVGCTLLYNAGSTRTATALTNPPGSGCPVEVYTLKVVPASTTGAQRELESKILINCTGDVNP